MNAVGPPGSMVWVTWETDAGLRSYGFGPTPEDLRRLRTHLQTTTEAGIWKLASNPFAVRGDWPATHVAAAKAAIQPYHDPSQVVFPTAADAPAQHLPPTPEVLAQERGIEQQLVAAGHQLWDDVPVQRTAFAESAAVDRRTREYQAWLHTGNMGVDPYTKEALVRRAYESGAMAPGVTYGQLTSWVTEQVAPGYHSRYRPHIDYLNQLRATQAGLEGRPVPEKIHPLTIGEWSRYSAAGMARTFLTVDPSQTPEGVGGTPEYGKLGLFKRGSSEMATQMTAFEHAFIPYLGGGKYGLTTTPDKWLKRTQLHGIHPQVYLQGPGVQRTFEQPLLAGRSSLKRDTAQTVMAVAIAGELGVSGQGFYDPAQITGVTRPVRHTVWERPGMPLPTWQEAEQRRGEVWQTGQVFQAVPGHEGWENPWHRATLAGVSEVFEGETRGLEYHWTGQVAPHRWAIKAGTAKSMVRPGTWVGDITRAGTDERVGASMVLPIKDISGYIYDWMRAQEPAQLASTLGVQQLPASYQELGRRPYDVFMSQVLPQLTQEVDIPQTIHADYAKMMVGRGTVWQGGQHITDPSQLRMRKVTGAAGPSNLYDVQLRTPALVGPIAVQAMEEYGVKGQPFLNWWELQRLKIADAERAAKGIPSVSEQLLNRPDVIATQGIYQSAYEAVLFNAGVARARPGTPTIQMGEDTMTEVPGLSPMKVAAHIAEIENELMAEHKVGQLADLPRGAADRALMERLSLRSGKYDQPWAFSAGGKQALMLPGHVAGYFGASGDFSEEEVSGVVRGSAGMLRAYAAGGVGMPEAIEKYRSAMDKMAGGKALVKRIGGISLPGAHGDVLAGTFALGAQQFYHPKFREGELGMIFGSPGTGGSYSGIYEAVSQEQAARAGLDVRRSWFSGLQIQEKARDADGDLAAVMRLPGVGIRPNGIFYDLRTGKDIGPREKLLSTIDEMVGRATHELQMGAGNLEDELLQAQTKEQFTTRLREKFPMHEATSMEIAAEMEKTTLLQAQRGLVHNTALYGRGSLIGKDFSGLSQEERAQVGWAQAGAEKVFSSFYSPIQRPAELGRGAAGVYKATHATWRTGWLLNRQTRQLEQGFRGKGPSNQLAQIVRSLVDPHYATQEGKIVPGGEETRLHVGEATGFVNPMAYPEQFGNIAKAMSAAMAAPTSELAVSDVMEQIMMSAPGERMPVGRYLLSGAPAAALVTAVAGTSAVNYAKREGLDPIETISKFTGSSMTLSRQIYEHIPRAAAIVTGFKPLKKGLAGEERAKALREQVMALIHLGVVPGLSGLILPETPEEMEAVLEQAAALEGVSPEEIMATATGGRGGAGAPPPPVATAAAGDEDWQFETDWSAEKPLEGGTTIAGPTAKGAVRAARHEQAQKRSVLLGSIAGELGISKAELLKGRPGLIDIVDTAMGGGQSGGDRPKAADKPLIPYSVDLDETVHGLNKNLKDLTSRVGEIAQAFEAGRINQDEYNKQIGAAGTQANKLSTAIGKLGGFGPAEDEGIQGIREFLAGTGRTRLSAFALQAGVAQGAAGIAALGGGGGAPPAPWWEPDIGGVFGGMQKGFGKLFGGWGMFYINRMIGLGTRMAQKGITQFAADQQALYQSMYQAGLAETAIGGAPGEMMEMQAGVSATWSGIGRAAWSTWGPTVQSVMGLGERGGGPLGAIASVAMPALAAGAATGFISGSFGGPLVGSLVGMAVAGMTANYAYTAYQEGQLADVEGRIIDRIMGRGDVAAEGELRAWRQAQAVAAGIEPTATVLGVTRGRPAAAAASTIAVPVDPSVWASTQTMRTIAGQANVAPVVAANLAGLSRLAPLEQRAALGVFAEQNRPEWMPIETFNQIYGMTLPYLGDQGISPALIGRLGKQIMGGGDPFTFAQALLQATGASVLNDPRAMINALTKADWFEPWKLGPIEERLKALAPYQGVTSRVAPIRPTTGLRNQVTGEIPRYMMSGSVNIAAISDSEFGRLVAGRALQQQFMELGGTPWDMRIPDYPVLQEMQFVNQGAGSVLSQAWGRGISSTAGWADALKSPVSQMRMSRFLSGDQRLWSQLISQDFGSQWGRGLASHYGLEPTINTETSIPIATEQGWALQLASAGASYQSAMFNVGQAREALGFRQAMTWGGEYGGVDFGAGTWALQWQQQQASWGASQRQMGLQRQMMELGYQQFLEQQGFQAQQQAVQFGWQREDLALNRGQAQLQYGWQMQDMQDAIRRSTGYERSQLVRQRERQTIMYTMQQGRFDTQEERIDQQEEWAEELQEMQRRHYEERMELQRQQHQASVDALNAQIGLATELHRIQEEYMRFQEQQEEERIDHAEEMAGIQAGLAAQSVAIAKQQAIATANLETFIVDLLPELMAFLEEMGVVFPRTLDDAIDKVETIGRIISGWSPGSGQQPDGGGGGTSNDTPTSSGGGEETNNPPRPQTPSRPGYYPGEEYRSGGHLWRWNAGTGAWDLIYHEGTTFVTETGLATVQAGEMIVPAREVAAMVAGRGWGEDSIQLAEIIRLLVLILGAIERGALVINVTGRAPDAVAGALNLWEQTWAG